MATLAVQNAKEAGNVAFVAASGGGDVVPNDGKTVLLFWNDDSSLAIVTVTAQDTTATAAGFGAITKADAVKSIAADTADVMGPFPTTAFNNSSAQIVVTYSSVSDLAVAAVRVSGAT